jgi:cytochrome P450
LVLLFDNPAFMERLRREPELMPGAIEEIMRFDGPAGVVPRVALSDVELAGQHIKAGQLVFLALTSGNRDERKFERADAFDITRDEAKRHLGFGMGAFYCLGAALARMEAQVCFTTLLRRLPNLRPGAGERRIETSTPLGRQYKSIPIAWDPA